MSQYENKTIFEYDDYREFLRDFFARRKRQDKKFSFRFFARLAGYRTHSFVLKVVNGKADLPEMSLDKFVKGLHLNKEEGLFFKNLVRMNQAASVEEKHIYAKELVRSRTSRKIHPLKELQFNYVSHWYFITVREMVQLQNFREDPEWIALHTIPQIKPSEARHALQELCKLGLLSRNAEGRLIQTETHLNADNMLISGLRALYHKEMLKKASEAIDFVSRDKRDISSVTFSIPIENIEKIKDKIVKFREEILEMVSHEISSNSVYQLNLQLFPSAEISHSKKREKK